MNATIKKTRKSNFVGIKVDDSLLQTITEDANKSERSVSAQIRNILNNHYNKRNK